jgi:hypothetical protein
MGTIRLSAAQFAAADQSCAAANAVGAVVSDAVGDYQSAAVTTDNILYPGTVPVPFDNVGSDATQVPVD